ncbi:MAG: M56 family metallopeptidase [Jiangellaceae bacterium]
MNVALILWGYAAVLATVGGVAMRRAGWVDRAPRLAIATWQALSLSTLLAVAFGGLALIVPTHLLSVSLAHWVESCAMMLRAQYATPGGAALATSGLVLAMAVLARWAYYSVVEFSRNAAARRRHHDVLALVGRAALDPGVTVLDDDRPYVYCVAGRRHRIVLTTGASSRLDTAQMSAVLAHERAHLRGRHHLVIGAAGALARAFPWLPMFAVARDEVTRLVELVADDRASRSVHRFDLAEAMLTLSAGAPPAGALAIGGSSAAARVRRLIAGHRPIQAWAVAVGVSAVVTLVAAPLIALATPAVMAGPDCCATEQQHAAAAEECWSASPGCLHLPVRG